ncbi:MAG: sigma-70 family RNA polymerase sigma factor [Planctomycetes bacterium]|nr:sigma-70 family RNA polymerase sigma factor [Planctomycetota bacterium]
MIGEDDLVLRAVEGDALALEQLLRDATPFLRAELGIDPRWRRDLDAEDVLQVTFLEAFLRVRSLEQRTVAGFRAWLRQLTRHNLVDAIRALERAKRPSPKHRVTRGPDGESARTLLLSLSDGRQSVCSRASLAEDVARLHAAVAALPASYRLVVQQVDLEQRPVTELAREMGRSEGAVHMLRSRAHERLYELLRT